MQTLLCLQSLWAMERRHTDGFERSLEDNIGMIIAAGFDGISTDWRNRDTARRITSLLKPHGKVAEGQCFPRTIDDLKPPNACRCWKAGVGWRSRWISRCISRPIATA